MVPGHDTKLHDHPLAVRFAEFIEDSGFVCVGAKAALAREKIEILIARDLASAWNDVEIYGRLSAFAREYQKDRSLYRSFVVLFEHSRGLSEREFERLLWTRVQSLSNKDALHGQPYDESVSADPEDNHFSLSFAGEAFFIVGLHPFASRPARRFEVPALVFNLHDQFQILRQSGIYEKMRKSILERDLKLAGSLNPMLARHGEMSEARQYSGRAVDANWKCPFDPKQRDSFDAF
jgi:FPC/CPF motif-containing protein YcgG